MKPIEFDEIETVSTKLDLEFTKINNYLAPADMAPIQERKFGSSLVALKDSGKPNSTYYNRIICMNTESLDALRGASDWYRDDDISCNCSLPPQKANEESVTALRAAGFHYVGADAVYFTRPTELPKVEDSPAVSILTGEEAGVSRVLIPELLSQATAPILRSVEELSQRYSSSSLEYFLAFIDGELAARASLFHSGRICWFSNAITKPEFRKRGCHAALISRRMRRARELGCNLVISDTEFHSASHRNLSKLGFQLAYVSAEFADS